MTDIPTIRRVLEPIHRQRRREADRRWIATLVIALGLYGLCLYLAERALR